MLAGVGCGGPGWLYEGMALILVCRLFLGGWPGSISGVQLVVIVNAF